MDNTVKSSSSTRVFTQPPDQHTLSFRNNRGPGLAPLTCLFVTHCTCYRKNSNCYTPGLQVAGNQVLKVQKASSVAARPDCRAGRSPELLSAIDREQSWQLRKTVAFNVRNCWRQVNCYWFYISHSWCIWCLPSLWLSDLTFTELPPYLRPENMGESTMVKPFQKLQKMPCLSCTSGNEVFHLRYTHTHTHTHTHIDATSFNCQSNF